MRLARKSLGFVAVALMSVGLMSPVAQAQAERIVAPEEQDAYVQEFFQDSDVTPVVDGSGGLTDADIEAFHQAVRDAEQAGPLNDEIIVGEMLSDKIILPPQVDKVTSDEAEVAVAKQQAQPQTFATTAATCHRFIFTAYDVCGAILQRYNQLGNLLSFLLDPIGPQIQNPDGVGFHQQFRNGFIFWHPDTGAHAITARNAEVFARNGWSAGWMGYPLGGEVPVSGSNPIEGELNGWVQLFQGGRIYRSPVLDGFQVASINGLVLDEWLNLGGSLGYLGFPIADEAKTSDGVGRFSLFQRGEIYWSPNSGAHAVSGTILDDWKKEGDTSGQFGYPTEAATWIDDFTYVQNFEGGSIQGKVFQGFAPNGLLSQYIQANSQEEADAYFDAIEDQWIAESLGSSRGSARDIGMPVKYGPCTLKPNDVHIRTKSGESDHGIVGYKPTTKCDVQVESIEHRSDLRYKYYNWWLKAASGTLTSKPGSSQLEQKNVEIICRGDNNTWFWGTTAGVIRFAGENYYARVYPKISELSCRV